MVRTLLISILLHFPLYADAPDIWQVPDRNQQFMERNTLMKQIHQGGNVVVLAGSSGFGKSQLAKEYAHQYSKGYNMVWWFSADADLGQQIKDLLAELNRKLDLNIGDKLYSYSHKQILQIIKDVLRSQNTKALIIFDGAHKYSEIKEYIPIPHSKSHKVIITTKNINFSQKTIFIPPFSRDQSIEYIDRFFKEASNELKVKLAAAMSDCPAGIAMSIDYIKNSPKLSLERYLDLLDSERDTLLHTLKTKHSQLGSALDGYTSDLFAVVKLALSHVKKKDQNAYQLLCFLSLLNHQEIDASLIKSWTRNKNIIEKENQLLSCLGTYSLVYFKKQNQKIIESLNMHDLIQKITNELISRSDKVEAIESACTIFIEEFSGRSDEFIAQTVKDGTLLRHAIRVSEIANSIDHHSQNLSIVRVRIMDVLVGVFREFKIANSVIESLNHDFFKS